MIADLFAGAGGWECGLRDHLDVTEPVIGLEWDAAACQTRAAAGHLTIRASVADYDPHVFAGKARGVAGSPPCGPFSNAGKQLGILDQPAILDHLHAVAARGEWISYRRDGWHDRRSPLVLEPLRWVLAIRPEWVLLEQVPAVLPFWRSLALVLERLGYSTWAGVVDAADYGVPQNRERALLLASRVKRVTAPPPTHSEHGAGGGTAAGGAEPFGNASRRAMRAAMNNPGHWAWKRPAHTIGGTVGHVAGKQSGGHLNLEPEEGALLQAFPAGYPFQGNKGQRSLQIGNAVPPLLAAHVAHEVSGIPWRSTAALDGAA